MRAIPRLVERQQHLTQTRHAAGYRPGPVGEDVEDPLLVVG